MSEYLFRCDFVASGYVIVEADSLEEAKEAVEEGEWCDEKIEDMEVSKVFVDQQVKTR